MYLAKSRVTVELEDIGPVLFERSLRAQHININVKPQGCTCSRSKRNFIPQSHQFCKIQNKLDSTSSEASESIA